MRKPRHWDQHYGDLYCPRDSATQQRTGDHYGHLGEFSRHARIDSHHLCSHHGFPFGQPYLCPGLPDSSFLRQWHIDNHCNGDLRSREYGRQPWLVDPDTGRSSMFTELRHAFEPNGKRGNLHRSANPADEQSVRNYHSNLHLRSSADGLGNHHSLRHYHFHLACLGAHSGE